MIPPYSTTGIGSLPHASASEACRAIIETFDIPFWPQLPGISYREWMVPQYSEGMPFVRFDDEKGSIWLDRKGREDELTRFYEGSSDDMRVAISENFAHGLHEFLRVIGRGRRETIKGHVTGPITFLLSLKDSDGKPVYFDEELREIGLMLLKAKVRWQLDVLKPHANNVIIFIDEPLLSALGQSAYLGVRDEDVSRLLGEVTATINDSGGISGIHCCGRADWPAVMNTGTKILNFDAYEYADTLAIYHNELNRFIESGGTLAWGIIPTSEAIRDVTEESLISRFREKFEGFSKHIPVDRLSKNIMLTPSCGTGSRTVDETLKIFQLLIRLKEAVAS